jgi:hypothetical protein
MDHPNVLYMLAAGRSAMFRNGESDGKEVFYIVSEVAENGECFDYIAAA